MKLFRESLIVAEADLKLATDEEKLRCGERAEKREFVAPPEKPPI